MAMQEITPQEIQAMRIKDAFERVADATPTVRNPAIFELLSQVPGIRIMDNADLKMRVAETIESDENVTTFRLDLNGQDDFQLLSGLVTGSESAMFFYSSKKNSQEYQPRVIVMLFYNTQTGNREDVIIDYTRSDGTRYTYKQFGVLTKYKGKSDWKWIDSLDSQELASFMVSMLRGDEPVFPDRMQ